MRNRSRSPLRRIAALTLVALVAAGCGGKSGSDTTPTTSGGSTGSTSESTVPVLTNAPTTTDPEVKPQSGGSLVIGMDADSSGYNPTVDPWAAGGHNVARALYDPLATYDAGGKVVPYLAESITANDDATVWTITLRSGVKFHDGTPLDAAAVKANFDANKNSPQFGSQLQLLSETKVVDDLTVELDMSQPWSTFPNVLVGDLGSQIGYIASPATISSPDGGRNPVGTGPFKLKEWVPDDHITLVRNDDYWQQPAYLDEVTFKPIPDATARKAAFDAGDIDLYYTGSSSEITEYQGQPDKFSTTIGAPGEPDMVLFNTAQAPLDDVRVRRALVMATDMNRLFDFLDATGVKQIVHGPYADTSFWYTKSNYPDYDLEGAKKLIEEYTAETGNKVEFNFQGNQIPFVTSVQELYQSMWAEAGITANIVSKAQGENIQAAIGGDFQVLMWGGIGGGDPDNDYNDFHSGPLNFSRFSTPEMDAALEKGRALTDPDARKEQYAIVQQILGDNVPILWAGSNQYGVITKPNVQGIADFTLPDGSAGQAITSSEFFLKDVWLKP